MAFDDKFRLSSHGVLTNELGQVLLLKANYGNFAWGLPGGALEMGETIHQALLRECREELGCEVEIAYLSGVYFHQAYQSHAFIFRCHFKASHAANIQLSDEHTCFAFHDIDSLSEVQRQRVTDCLNYQGNVVSATF